MSQRVEKVFSPCVEQEYTVGPRFPGAKRTETGWADGVFLLHAWRKDFFNTLKASVNFF